MHIEIWTPYLKVISVYTAHRHKENVPLVNEHYKSNESDDKQIFILLGIKKQRAAGNQFLSCAAGDYL